MLIRDTPSICNALTHNKQLKGNEIPEIENLYSKIYFFQNLGYTGMIFKWNLSVISADTSHTINNATHRHTVSTWKATKSLRSKIYIRKYFFQNFGCTGMIFKRNLLVTNAGPRYTVSNATHWHTVSAWKATKSLRFEIYIRKSMVKYCHSFRKYRNKSKGSFQLVFFELSKS